MNNGVTKGCEPETFAALKRRPSIQAIYQVHRNRRPDGAQQHAAESYIANDAEECQANYIKLSVAPDGKSYTLSIPATGHEATYETK